MLTTGIFQRSNVIYSLLTNFVLIGYSALLSVSMSPSKYKCPYYYSVPQPANQSDPVN